MEPVISIKNIYKSYGYKPVLRNLPFTLPEKMQDKAGTFIKGLTLICSLVL